ncbi:TonB-dependent receptor [Paraflavisolibacter sp. H34]|uniref:SusC/RagA family TonB-linked outer membrane protein n=1 Tax=Huijunlia imazamoxiresistens TaxID=3127457 RepID=UPI0030191327
MNRTLLPKCLCALLLLALLCGPAAAQPRVVSGTVTDPTGSPLSGATVNIRGQKVATTTDSLGRFSLSLPAGSHQLTVSFVGMETQDLDVAGKTEIAVQLPFGSAHLNTVVVVGYGTQKQKDVTGSVATLSAKEFNQGAQLSPQQLIQGKMAGVNVAQNSGKPGGSNTVRIRGGTSITASNEPLYVIDGVAIATTSSGRQVNLNTADIQMFDQEPVNPLNSLNPADIENITVLKDASAAAIYGARGANGVILITTRSGAAGAVRTTYTNRFGLSAVTRQLRMLNAQEYKKAVTDRNLTLVDSGAATNWQDEIFQKAFSHDHNLSLSGGSTATQYRASLGYNNLQGVVLGSKQSIATARINIRHKALDNKLDLDFRITGAQIAARNAPISNTVSNESGTNMLYDAYVFNPTFPVYKPNGDFQQYSQFTVNPVSYAKQIEDESTTRRFLGSLSTTYRLTDALRLNLNLGYTWQNIVRHSYIRKASPLGNAWGGLANAQNNEDWSQLLEITPQYQRQWGDHRLQAVAGYSIQYFVEEGGRAQASDFISDDFKWNSLQAARSIRALSSYKSSNALLSWFGRVNYSLSDRYLLTATLRRDGSSRFGSGNKWGTFPSGSIAWRISREAFFPASFVTDLKLRTSYGLTGNQEIGNLNAVSTLGARTTGYIIGGVRQTVVLPQQYANPDLRWEQTAQLDAGLDFELWNGRLSGTLDFYNKITSDLLLRVNLPSPTVVADQLANVGKVRNRGVELTLDARLLQTADFSWRVNGNLSVNRNQVLSLSNAAFSTDKIEFAPVQGSGLNGVTAQLITPGQPLGTFYGLVYLGTKDGAEQFAPQKALIGNAQPNFLYGLGATFTWKQFDGQLAFRGSQGNDLLNLTRLNLSYQSNLPGKNVLQSALETGLDRQAPKRYSSRWIEDGSYLRLDNLTLGYTFTLPALQPSNNLRVYVSGQNLLLLTGYSGQDPEVNSNVNGSGTVPLGIDYLSYPRSRTFSIGGSFTF